MNDSLFERNCIGVFRCVLLKILEYFIMVVVILVEHVTYGLLRLFIPFLPNEKHRWFVLDDEKKSENADETE